MDFELELKNRVREVEQVITGFLPEEKGPQSTVLKAMNYSVQAGGKRLRPMLIMETYRLFGGCGKAVEPFMAAMEMIHSYSLVHDDLPALDNDEYRRGKKSTHAAFGEAMGILAGDALLNYAFETAVKAFDLETDGKRVAEALKILARKAGIYGMIGGQTVDVESEGKHLSPELLTFIHENKTGALIEAAMMIGAVLAGADEASVKTVETVAGKIGMAFQIRDDILDVTGTQEEIGKPIGSDAKNEKVTWVSMYGLENAEREVETLSEDAVRLLETLPNENLFLKQLLLSLTGRTH